MGRPQLSGEPREPSNRNRGLSGNGRPAASGQFQPANAGCALGTCQNRTRPRIGREMSKCTPTPWLVMGGGFSLSGAAPDKQNTDGHLPSRPAHSLPSPGFPDPIRLQPSSYARRQVLAPAFSFGEYVFA
jgi:hypothetical protein